MGLLVQSDCAKSDGIKSDWRIRWPSRQILAQNPTTRPIGFSNRKIEKWRRSLIMYSGVKI